MLLPQTCLVAAAILACLGGVCWAQSEPLNCSVTAVTDRGAVCGLRRVAADGRVYASFRGVPYAKQPLGALRFQELQEAEPWLDQLNATVEGPVCPQYDTFYGRLVYPDRVQSEACIHANIHVPLNALPGSSNVSETSTGLPILVFIHGGGFAFGSGDADLHGPEYLVTKEVVVITFNYRLNVFGFLTLNSTKIPGNNGLRDALSLLRWVQRNAANFGGNPNNVTLAGQSAGALMAHLLSLVPVADGLFHRLMLFSSTASPMFFSAAPAYAKSITDQFLLQLNITATDSDEILEMPLETLMAANQAVQDILGLVTFAPVVESTTAANLTTTILNEDPDVLMEQGSGKNMPIMIGVTSKECESFRPLFSSLNIVSQIEQDTTIPLFPKVKTVVTAEVTSELAAEIQEKYFQPLSLDNYVEYCSNAYIKYPAIKLAKQRAAQGAAPTYFLQFAYNNENNVMRRLNNLTYTGASHVEDLTYWFRVNTGLPPTQLQVPSEEDPMMERMTTFISNYIICGAPICDSTSWTPLSSEDVSYQLIQTADLDTYTPSPLTTEEEDMYSFFKSIESRQS